MSQRSILLLNSHRLFQILHIHSGEGPLGGELLDFPPQLLHQLGALLALLFGRSGGDEVFQKLAAGFLLNQQRNLDSTMQEFRDGLDIRFEHVTRSQSRRSEPDPTGCLRRSVARNRVLCGNKGKRHVKELVRPPHC